MQNLSTAPATERGPAPSPAPARRSSWPPASGHLEQVGAAVCGPKRVPARWRGRET